jgi:hypothetical protein
MLSRTRRLGRRLVREWADRWPLSKSATLTILKNSLKQWQIICGYLPGASGTVQADRSLHYLTAILYAQNSIAPRVGAAYLMN